MNNLENKLTSMRSGTDKNFKGSLKGSPVVVRVSKGVDSRFNIVVLNPDNTRVASIPERRMLTIKGAVSHLS